MQRSLFAALTGALFGLGLVVSGMTDTNKVQGWLDIFGAWDPSLAFVLGGAMIPMALAWLFARTRRRSVLGSPMPSPARREIDRGLVIGSTLFGAGWALAGFCPGPAMASVSFGGLGGLVFLLAMIVAMMISPAVRRILDRSAEA